MTEGATLLRAYLSQGRHIPLWFGSNRAAWLTAYDNKSHAISIQECITASRMSWWRQQEMCLVKPMRYFQLHEIALDMNKSISVNLQQASYATVRQSKFHAETKFQHLQILSVETTHLQCICSISWLPTPIMQATIEGIWVNYHHKIRKFPTTERYKLL